MKKRETHRSIASRCVLRFVLLRADFNMGDLTDPRLIYLKGFLFLIAGILASAGIILLNPTMQTVFFLGVSIWSFCRLYYFMFYVIEKYVDSNYRFAGIHSFLFYLVKTRKELQKQTPSDHRKVENTFDQ